MTKKYLYLFPYAKSRAARKLLKTRRGRDGFRVGCNSRFSGGEVAATFTSGVFVCGQGVPDTFSAALQ